MAVLMPEDRRRRLCDWLIENGLNPNVIPEDSAIHFEHGKGEQIILHYTVYEFDADGRPILELDGSVRQSHRTAPLTVPPPPELGGRP